MQAEKHETFNCLFGARGFGGWVQGSTLEVRV